MSSKKPVPRAGQTAAGGIPAAPTGPHNLFLAALPFAVVIAVAITDVAAGPGVGFLPVLSLGPALAAVSRRPLPTALIGILTLGLGVLLAFYDNLASSRRGVIALITIAGVTAAGVLASAGRAPGTGTGELQVDRRRGTADPAAPGARPDPASRHRRALRFRRCLSADRR